MLYLEFERRKQDLSQRELGRRARVDVGDICRAERRGLSLYQPQLQRLAEALAWEEDPSGLLQEVG